MEDPVASKVFGSMLHQFIQRTPFAAAPEGSILKMLSEMMKYMPLRFLVSLTNGAITEEMLESLIQRISQEMN